MLRYLREPVDAGIYHLDAWVETLGNGFLDDRASKRFEDF